MLERFLVQPRCTPLVVDVLDDDLWDHKPSIWKCSYCKKKLTPKTRFVEPRETGPNCEIQLWGFCKKCAWEQYKDRRKTFDVGVIRQIVTEVGAPAPNLRSTL